MFKASVQEARLMWGGTLGQRFFPCSVTRFAYRSLLPLRPSRGDLEGRLAAERRS